ncbi:hypothetical protein ALC56_00828, partial [Trachymyrmex septentrionalis]
IFTQGDYNPNLGSAHVNIGLPLQKSSLSTHSPLPHDNFPSGQTGSSVLRMGKTLRGSAKYNLR